MTEPVLKDTERLDDLECRGYRIIQDPSGFCFGMDAVLLSAFVRCGPDAKCLDLGTGNGVIPLLMCGKDKGSSFCGLEILEDYADRARRSVRLNGLEDRIRISTGDLKEAEKFYPAASFDVVTCNPPYMLADHGIISENHDKMAARHELFCTLEDVVRAAAVMLAPKGQFFMVHRPFRLTDILTLMRRYSLEPKELQMVQPFADKEPNLVLVRGARGGRPGMKVRETLTVYESPGNYTREVLRMYGKE